jgi:hypothetical protein
VVLTPDKRKVALIAFDDGQVIPVEDRENALQKKLVSYLQFVVSGQFLRAYPGHGDLGVCVTVVCMVPPTEGMKKIKGIRDHERPESFLSVEVTTDAEFRTSFAKPRR